MSKESEKPVMYTQYEWDTMPSHEKNIINSYSGAGTGIGIIILGIIIYQFYIAAKFFFLEVPFIEPLYFITNPIWLIPLILLSGFRFFEYFFYLYILIVTPFIFAMLLSFEGIFNGFNITTLTYYTDLMYNFAYGEIGEKINYLKIGLALADIKHPFFMQSMIILNLVIIAISFFIFYQICVRLILKFSSKGRDIEGKGFFSIIFTFIAVCLLSTSLFPLLLMTQDLPYGLNIFITWNLIFYPFLGFRLALTNRSRKKEDKVGTFFTYYYIAFGLLVVPIFLYLKGILVIEISRALSFDIYSINLFIPVLLVPYLFLSLKEKKDNKKA